VAEIKQFPNSRNEHETQLSHVFRGYRKIQELLNDPTTEYLDYCLCIRRCYVDSNGESRIQPSFIADISKEESLELLIDMVEYLKTET
jgi:hypothetical protein